MESAYGLHMADEVDELDRVHRSEILSDVNELVRVHHWSELLDDEDDDFDDDSALAADNLEVFRGLQEQWPGGFFQVMGDEWEVGRKFAEGGQAEIFEAERTLPDGTKDKWVLKTFEPGSELRVLMRMFPEGMLTNLGPNGRYSNDHSCSVYGLMMLQNGRRFAILLKRYWGDLRNLIDHIDLRMQRRSNQDLPFPDMSMVVHIMLDIALGIQALHKDGILHKDVKAANVFIWPLGDDSDPIYGGKFRCHVANFETSVGVVGSGFFRAPEILEACKIGNISRQYPDLFTPKSDVYSFAMTCYEILTGRMPFEGCPLNDYDAVLGGTRPELPESIDPWIKELVERCWHPVAFQRPSFKEIVDILQARIGEGRELENLAPRSSTWEELNDPRVTTDQDLNMEIPEKFPILIEMLAAALQRCEEEVGKIRRCKDQVRMFEVQCAHLVASLSSDADEMIRRFQQALQILKEPVITDAHRQRFELRFWFTCVAFGIHSLVDLTRNFQNVVEMLSECAAEDCWKTALQYSNTPPHPEIPRWSVFGLALQQCQWSMDIADLAIKETTDLAMGFGDWMFDDPGFQWCEERQRAVLDSTKELHGNLGVFTTLEAQDKDELLKKLEMVLDNSLQRKSHKNEFRLASFLMAKLAGPIPEAKYLPYTFQIDPPVNLVARSSDTALWCGKILCHVKKVKGPGYEVRKTMERDAVPLATVQHTNVVHLIGCTVQTSEDVTGLTEILTKLVYPSKKKRLDETTGVLVMELMEGDLRSLMDQRCPNPGPGSWPFPLIVALDIMLQIAQAMRFVHQHKILHRDLKTTNILYNSASTGALPSYPTLDLDRIRELELLYLLTPERYYTVKLADFGLAKYSPNESSLIVDAIIGTPPYMAPEMFYNSEAELPSEYNWSCDVYSFAMTCSAILTGNEPFHFVRNSTRFNVMASVVGSTAQVQDRPALGLGEALPSLKSLLERCWDQDPLKRPPFSEICKELWDCKLKATISCLRRDRPSSQLSPVPTFQKVKHIKRRVKALLFSCTH